VKAAELPIYCLHGHTRRRGMDLEQRASSDGESSTGQIEPLLVRKRNTDINFFAVVCFLSSFRKHPSAAATCLLYDLHCLVAALLRPTLCAFSGSGQRC
jgi:hypothetical protein